MSRPPLPWIVVLTMFVVACTGQLTPPPDPAPPPPPTPVAALPCTDRFARGRPVSSLPTAFLCKAGYAVLHSPTRKTPLVVAERLEPVNFDGSTARTEDFRSDPELLIGERSELEDYRLSGYDRGHMAPSADFSSSAARVSESFLLSNIVPQNPSLNSGWWASLESATRACARSEGVVFVLSGPVFSDPSATIGAGRVNVPSSVYKIIVGASGNSRAYLIQNAAPWQKGFKAYQVAISSIEALTNLAFFPTGGVDESALGSLCTGAYGS